MRAFVVSLAIFSILIIEGPERREINEPTKPLLQSIAVGNRAERRCRRHRARWHIERQLTRDPAFSPNPRERVRKDADDGNCRWKNERRL